MRKYFPVEKDLDGFNEFLPSDHIPVAGLPDAIRDQKSAWLNTISVRAVFSAEVEDGDLVVPVVRDETNDWYHPDTVWVPALGPAAVMQAENESDATYQPKFYGMAYKGLNRVMLGPLVYHPTYKFRAGDILYATANGKMTTEQTEVFVGACLAPGYVLLHGTAQNIDLFKKAAELTKRAETAASTSVEMADQVVEVGEAQIKRMEELAEQLLIIGVSYNKYTVADISTQIAEGTQIALPEYEGAQMSYIVGSNTLLLCHNGTWMLPGEQYTEVGTAGLPSAVIQLNQELQPGDKLGVLILSQYTKVLLSADSGLGFKENGELYIAPVTAEGTTTARPLAERFADIVNVKDFGAKGDGATFDQEAFDAAILSGAKTIYIPDGTYIINGIFINRPVHIIASDGAVIKRNHWNRTYYADRGMYTDITTPQSRSGLLTFFQSAHGSSVTGGTWDMNCWEYIDEYNINDVKAVAELDPNYDFQRCLCFLYAYEVRVENVVLKNAPTRGIDAQYAHRSIFRNIHIYNCEGGFSFHVGNCMVIEDIVCKNSSNRVRVIGDPDSWRTGEEYLLTYQHNSVFRQTNHSVIRGIIFDGFAPLEGVGTEPHPCMLTLERPEHSTFTDILMKNRVNEPGIVSIGLSVIGAYSVSLSNIDIADHVRGIDLNGCIDTHLSNFHINNNWYLPEYHSHAIGLQVSNGAWAQHGNVSTSDAFMLAESKNVQVSNGEISNAFVGVTCHASNTIFRDVAVRGCHVGWSLLKENDELDCVNNSILNCTASYCAKAGIQLSHQKNAVIDRCEVYGNGWNTTLTNAERSGLYLFGNVEYAKITNCAFYNEENVTKDKGLSFAPGVPTVITDGDNRYPYRFTFVSPDPSQYQIGQTCFIRGLFDGDNLYGHVLDVKWDNVTIGWTLAIPSGEVTPSDEDIVQMSGTISNNGKTVTGVGTRFTTETGRSTYIKFGGEYHLIAQVKSDTEIDLATKPSTNYNNVPVANVYVRTFQEKKYQQNGVYIATTAAHSVYYKDNVEYGNVRTPIVVTTNASVCADSEYKKSSGIQDFAGQKAPYLSVVQPYDVPQYWKVNVVEKVEGADHLEVRLQVGTNYTTLAESISTVAGTVAGGVLPNVPQTGLYYLQVVARDSSNTSVTAASGQVYGYVKVRRSVPNEFFD